MRTSTLKLLAVFASLVLLLGACGGGDDDDDAVSSTDDTAQTDDGDEGDDGADEGDAPDAAEDKAAAEEIVLKLADVGEGYTEAEDTDTTSTTAAGGDEAADDPADTLQECAGDSEFFEDDDSARSAEAEFTNTTSGASINNKVSYAESADDVEEAFELLASDEFLTCFNDALKELMGAEMGDAAPGAEVSVDSAKLPVEADVDDASGIEVTINASFGGQSMAFKMQFVFLREGRVGTVLMTFGQQEPFPAAERERLTGILAERMAA